MASLSVVFADGAGLLGRITPANQRVDQRRLSDARRADQSHGSAEGAPLGESRRRIRGPRVQRNDWKPTLQGRSLVLESRRIDRRIGLGEQHNRARSSLVCECKIALQAGDVEIGIARGDDEKRVDVCGGKLRHLATFRAALQHCPSSQAPVQRLSPRIGKNPVTNAELARAGVNRQVQLDQPGL
jgi:hypothetical protein